MRVFVDQAKSCCDGGSHYAVLSRPVATQWGDATVTREEGFALLELVHRWGDLASMSSIPPRSDAFTQCADELRAFVVDARRLSGGTLQ